MDHLQAIGSLYRYARFEVKHMSFVFRQLLIENDDNIAGSACLISVHQKRSCQKTHEILLYVPQNVCNLIPSVWVHTSLSIGLIKRVWFGSSYCCTHVCVLCATCADTPSHDAFSRQRHVSTMDEIDHPWTRNCDENHAVDSAVRMGWWRYDTILK